MNFLRIVNFSKKIIKLYIKIAEILFIRQGLSIVLKKSKKPEINLTSCTNMVLEGAKRRRMTAYSADKTLNSSTGIKTNIYAVK